MKMIFAIVIFVVIVTGTYLLGNGSSFRRESPESPAVPENGAFTQDVSVIPEAGPTHEIRLQDGATHDIEIYPVKKKIGGRWVRMLSYGGSVPGPTIRVKEGSTVRIRLSNGGDGDTTMHSHGVRLDNAFDGVPGLTQDPIPVGGSFEYVLRFPDPGTYWYHPHVRQDYGQEMGLYGNFIVEPADATYWNPADREVTLMLDDILLDRNGGMAVFGGTEARLALMGRYGNEVLLNGESSYRLDVRPGEVVRLLLTNAANARPFRFGVAGVRLKVVGADLGRYGSEFLSDTVTLGPGERRIVEVRFDAEGEYAIENRTPAGTGVLGTIAVSGETMRSGAYDNFARLRVNAPERDSFEGLITTRHMGRLPDRELTLDVEMGGMAMDHSGHMMGMSGSDDGIEWEDSMPGMNAMSTAGNTRWQMVDRKTGKANMDIDDWNFRRGDYVKVRIENPESGMHPMQHPIHFHGTRFVVLATDNVRNENPVWQDTTLVPKGGTVDILVEMDNPGIWMAHCHIAEHAEASMMMIFRVRE